MKPIFGVNEKKSIRRYWIACFACVVVFLGTLVFSAGANSENQNHQTSISSVQSDVFAQVCQLIYKGSFDVAGKMVADKSGGLAELGEIAQITEQYKEIDSRRQEVRGKAYQEKLERLEKLHLGLDISDANEIDNIADANDVNDTKTTSILSVAASLVEIADEKQKQQIISHPAVQKAFEDAKAEAAKYEAQGKWLDAYINCYYWLPLIDKNNKHYKQYSEELMEKASIVASFQDSPCESRAERYDRIEKQMFERAIEVVHSQYVNPQFLDYSKMALKGIHRSKLLAQVVRASFDQIQKSKNGDSPQPALGQALYCPDVSSIAAWEAALAAIEAEIEKSSSTISREKFLSYFDKVLLLNKTTVALPEGVVIAHFAEAALGVLDPHTVIVWPQQVQDFQKSLTGEFAGIGVVISREKGLLTATSLLPDTPAYTSGLDAGDIIEMVDDSTTKDMSLTCAVKKITGPAGTQVKLTVRTPGQDKNREIVITRAKIVVKTVRGWQQTESGDWRYMLDEDRKIAYVRITNFAEKTANDLRGVLDSLEQQGLRGLILDLRYNQGGLLESAVEIADNFISSGLIVRTQPRWGIATYLSAQARGTRPSYPLVVLVNNNSASASEIVAGALQDPKYQRAIIVGERTHGKGSVQAITYRPGGGAQLKYTMAYYHLPSGQRVESRDDMERLNRKDWGIGPDIEVELIPDEIRTMSEVQRDNEVLVKADHDAETAPLKKHTAEKTLASDPQLNVALLVVRTKLLEQERLVAATK
ncbi:MAG: S41 family peptidase [Phycisphaerae bacterium]